MRRGIALGDSIGFAALERAHDDYVLNRYLDSLDEDEDASEDDEDQE